MKKWEINWILVILVFCIVVLMSCIYETVDDLREREFVKDERIKIMFADIEVLKEQSDRKREAIVKLINRSEEQIKTSKLISDRCSNIEQETNVLKKDCSKIEQEHKNHKHKFWSGVVK